MKGMSIAACITMVLAVLIGLSPLLVLFSGAGGADFDQVGWVYLFVTIPAGALLGLVAVVLSIIVSFIGISRARGTSTPRLIIAVCAAAAMLLSICGTVAALISSIDPNLLLAFVALSLIGFILAMVTGFAAPGAQDPRKGELGSQAEV